jgi:hypothetical protein
MKIENRIDEFLGEKKEITKRPPAMKYVQQLVSAYSKAKTPEEQRNVISALSLLSVISNFPDDYQRTLLPLVKKLIHRKKRASEKNPSQS